MKQTKEKFFKKDTAYLIIIIALALAVFFLLRQFPDNTPLSGEQSIESQILRELSQNTDVGGYAGYTTYVTLLTEQDLSALKSQQPAVYGDVQAGNYRVIYQGPDDSLLVIYDFQAKKILKLFVVQALTL